MAITAEPGFSHSVPTREESGARKLANGLGWFSIGLGVAEMLAPDVMFRMVGIRDTDTRRLLMRLCGMRELTAGLALVSEREPAGGIMMRVAGDLLDLAGIGVAAAQADKREAAGLSAAGGFVLGLTALDIYCSSQLVPATPWLSRPVSLTRSVIIQAEPEEVFRFWQNLERFPEFIDKLLPVHKIGDRWYHWRVAAPGDTTVEWVSELQVNQEQRSMSWHTLKGDIENSGEVRFTQATGGRGTQVTVDITYNAPLGRVSTYVAKLIRLEPGQFLDTALRRMKQIIETGEVVVSDATAQAGKQPAQPSSP